MVNAPRFTRSIRRLRWLGVLVAAVASLAAVTGCGGSDDQQAASGAAKGKTVVTIAYPAPVADHMIPAIAQSAGFFSKYGIDAKIVFLQGSEIVPALTSDKIQFSSLAAPTYEVTDLSGSDIKAVAQWERVFDVVLMGSPGHDSMQSLDGKSITTSAPATFSDLCADLAMQRYHIKMNKVPLGHLSNSIAAFESGQVDAISDLSPWQVAGVQQKLKGAKVLADFREFTGVPGIQLVGKSSWMQAHRQTTVNVIKAINDTVAWMGSHKADAVNTIAKITQSSQADASASYDSVMKSLSHDVTPSLAAERRILTLLAPSYPKAKGFDPAKVIDTSYAQAATGQ